MKKLIIPILFGAFLCLQPLELFAKTVCFAGGGGAAGVFWLFSGGKFDLKPFSGNLVSGGVTVPAWASIIVDGSGNLQMSIYNAHNPSFSFLNVWGSLSGPSTFSLSGNFDNGQDGTLDNAFTMTEVNCSTIPTAKPNDTPRPPGSFGSPAKAEQ